MITQPELKEFRINFYKLNRIDSFFAKKKLKLFTICVISSILILVVLILSVIFNRLSIFIITPLVSSFFAFTIISMVMDSKQWKASKKYKKVLHNMFERNKRKEK